MNALQKRLAKMDKKVRKVMPLEPEFFGWAGDPWTPEQQAEAIKRFPNAKQFWRPLLPKFATDPVTRSIVSPAAKPVE